MFLNLVYIIIISLLALIFGDNDTAQNRKKFLIISILVLMLGPSLRSLSYGVVEAGLDTYNYYDYFHTFREYSYSQIWSYFKGRYFGVGETEFDYGYVLLCKLIGIVTNNFHIYTFIALSLFFVPFGIFLYRHIDSIIGLVFAFSFYIALISQLSMGGARQLFALGMSIIVMLSYENKKYATAIIAFLLGVTLHLSVLLVIIPLLLERLTPKMLKRLHLVTLLTTPIVFAMPNSIILFMANVVGSEKYAEYATQGISGGALTFIALLWIMSAICFWAIKENDICPMVGKLWYAMLPCLTFFGPLINSSGSMMRISLYYFVYLPMLIPPSFQNLFGEGKDKHMMRVVSITLIALILMGRNIPYYFYWTVDPITFWR